MKKNTRRRGWPEAPSSSDLAALVRCEREFVAVQTEGEVRTQVRDARAREGEAEHARTERSMLAFHNTGRASRSARDRRCFLATEMYGPQAPRTQALRDWRDRVLIPSGAGRVLVRIYYATSPLLVRVVRRWPALRPWVGGLVDVAARLALRGAPP